MTRHFDFSKGSQAELSRRARIRGTLSPVYSSHPRGWRYADTSIPLEKFLASIRKV